MHLTTNNPTPIQEQAIPPALAGRDIIGCAQTGTGKTVAFILPALQHMLLGASAEASKSTAAWGAYRRRPEALDQALVVTPTRELAGQIEEVARDCAGCTGQRIAGVQQHRLRPQLGKLRRGVDLLVATPVACWTYRIVVTSTLATWRCWCWTKPIACLTWVSGPTCSASFDFYREATETCVSRPPFPTRYGGSPA